MTYLLKQPKGLLLCYTYSIDCKSIEQVTRTEPLPYKIVLALFCDNNIKQLHIVCVWGFAEFLGISQGSKLCSPFLNIS